MKKILFLIFFIYSLYADTYYAKLEPVDMITLKSEVNGKVVLAREDLEGKIANGLIVKIYDKLNREDLKSAKESLKLTNEMIKLNQNILPDLKKSMQKKFNLYQKVTNLDSTSLNNKNALFSAYIAAKNQFFATKEKILNLKAQRVNLQQKINSLIDLINKKSIKVKNKYLYSLNVKAGEFVNIGAPIATIADISKAKLTIYLNSDDLKDIDKKSIYIDGKKTDLKFNKIWKIADKEYISSYKAEIILKPFKEFSKLVKVEIKW